METAIALERLWARFPSMRLVEDEGAIAWRRRLGIRALVRLPVRLAA